jgi:ankyrin repeat protein
VFKLLIELKGADVNAADKYQNTPIDSALRSFNQTQGGDIALLTYLLNQENVDVNLKRQFGHTILHAACQHINTLTVDTFKVLIEAKHGDINAQNDNKSTPLHTALHFFQQSQGDDITALTYLLSHEEVNVNIKDQCGYTVLHQACLCESNIPLDIFKYLIEIKGADVNARDNFGNVPIHTAFLHFKPNAAGDITTLDYLLNQTDVNVRGRNGRNVLHLACTCGLTGPWGSSIWAIDAMWARVIEMIAERCVKLVLDGVAL